MKLPETLGAALDMGRRTLSKISETPSLDTQLLLCQVLERERAWLLAHLDAELNMPAGQRFLEMLARCEAGEPLPYVLGWKEFYGRRFRLDEHVLIPRPETELMVEKALEFLGSRTAGSLVADVGTGSGCVAVTLVAEAPVAGVVATDLSLPALHVARTNAYQHGVAERIQFIQADILSPFSGTFDLICANLPYIPEPRLAILDVAQREPRLALDGGEDGLKLIRRLIRSLPHRLQRSGQACIEIDQGQGELVLELSRNVLPHAQMRVHKDLAGLERLLVLECK